ncbi:dihydropteroate synthase, partial [Candidatus Thorarchaeota archaeon]
MVRRVVNIDGLQIGQDYPVRLMGILNLSPESFYKGTIASDKSTAKQLVEDMERDGADIIDVGVASTAPRNIYGTPEISEKEELKRLADVLGDISNSTNLPLSIDTVSSKVAEIALDMGVSLVNDISGLHADSKMAHLVHSKEVPIVLMANCGAPCGSIQSALGSLEESYTIAIKTGIGYEKILVDPGIGFG